MGRSSCPRAAGRRSRHALGSRHASQTTADRSAPTAFLESRSVRIGEDRRNRVASRSKGACSRVGTGSGGVGRRCSRGPSAMRRLLHPFVLVVSAILAAGYAYVAARLTSTVVARVALAVPFLMVWILPVVYW